MNYCWLESLWWLAVKEARKMPQALSSAKVINVSFFDKFIVWACEFFFALSKFSQGNKNFLLFWCHPSSVCTQWINIFRKYFYLFRHFSSLVINFIFAFIEILFTLYGKENKLQYRYTWKGKVRKKYWKEMLSEENVIKEKFRNDRCWHSLINLNLNQGR